MSKEKSNGLMGFLDSNEVTMKAESEFLENWQELFKEFWMDRIPDRKPLQKFDIGIQEGWKDEKEDKWIFHANIGDRAIVGLKSLRWYINQEYPISKITYNGIEVRKDQQQEFIDEVIFGDEEE